jgi:hypothetical protein
MLSGAPILWHSKRKTCVELSAMETEYIVLAEACQNSLWLRNMVLEIGVVSENLTIKLFVDNTACIVQANSVFVP